MTLGVPLMLTSPPATAASTPVTTTAAPTAALPFAELVALGVQDAPAGQTAPAPAPVPLPALPALPPTAPGPVPSSPPATLDMVAHLQLAGPQAPGSAAQAIGTEVAATQHPDIAAADLLPDLLPDLGATERDTAAAPTESDDESPIGAEPADALTATIPPVAIPVAPCVVAARSALELAASAVAAIDVDVRPAEMKSPAAAVPDTVTGLAQPRSTASAVPADFVPAAALPPAAPALPTAPLDAAVPDVQGQSLDTAIAAVHATPANNPDTRVETLTRLPPVLPQVAMPAKPEEGFSEVLGARMTFMLDQSISHARIRIAPEHLGAIDVQITVEGDRVAAAFHSQHADVRVAIESGLARLRDQLAEQGLHLAQTHVGSQSGDTGAQQGRPSSDEFPTPDAAGPRETSADATAATVIRRDGLVNEYA